MESAAGLAAGENSKWEDSEWEDSNWEDSNWEDSNGKDSKWDDSVWRRIFSYQIYLNPFGRDDLIKSKTDFAFRIRFSES